MKELIVLSLSLTSIVLAERLPIKTYTTIDGLAHNSVNRIVRDSRGFLWFCTFEGLSRFDGYSFTTYDTTHGLPSSVITDLLETRDGQYWVGTDAGLCRFNPSAAPGAMFVASSPGEDTKSKSVTVLLQGRNGTIWCGTAAGLYRLEMQEGEVRFRFIELGMPRVYSESSNVNSMTEDRQGALWIASTNGIYRLLPDGHAEHYSTLQGLPHNHVHSLLEDREGRLWAAFRDGGLCRLVADPSPQARSIVARAYTSRDGLPTTWINQLFQASDGNLWAGSNHGLIRFIPSTDGKDFHFQTYAQPNGLGAEEVQALAEDRHGNLWLGSANGGAARLSRGGITTFTEADGLKWTSAIFKDRAGNVLVVGGPNDEDHFFNRFDGQRFIRLELPQKRRYSWGWNQVMLQDRAEEWWIATGKGLCRFPRVPAVDRLAHAAPKAIYTTRNGLASDSILRVFEDSRGDIWVATVNPGGLSRWDRAREAFHHYAGERGVPSLLSFYPTSFGEDHSGNLWIGFSVGGGLVRYREGAFTQFNAADGLSQGGIFNLFVDASGSLWVPTTRGGVCRIDHPEAMHPLIRTYTIADGLSSNDVKTVTQDRLGRIYLGTGRGIDRLDPASGHIRHYTANEGALLGDVLAAIEDGDGALWFSYLTGLARLVPEADLKPIPPSVLISGLHIAGETRPVSAVGETEVTPLELGPNKNELQIDFVAPGFSPTEGLRYQYRLEGTGLDWSAPTDQRRVNLANLAPGRYRFEVRAIDSEGVSSAQPARFGFAIAPPIWRRWWFIATIWILMGLIVYELHRYRLRRLIEIERVRTRIATDLHDDIGSSLSQIAIMSEVIRREVDPADERVRRPLSTIAGVSRELVDSMSDIVWAINPRRDYLIDLTQRMRQFADDLLTASGIEFTFAGPGVEGNIPIETDIRREVFLIFKEALNNAVRHSGCSHIEIVFGVDRRGVMLKVADDGKGFDSWQSNGDHGLTNIRRRAENIAGTVEILAEAGQGTMVALQAPLHRRLRRFKITT